ncbi:gliding motility-associated C-terminal domain-containing protein [Aquimarina sp. ERC-38]|uniref:PKD domain-containing protein n=1 Tax=Aquimarina sp. ERC-38 TaxID=2949996 RepID=UPI00224787A0|nr:gliding motility-associated C-terminal domain-containing protein [Aquimarina sp. ERC-38]UZO80372.1 gliding motility-associated C-terminal domain-containing protein [Aquimarina sp. ERC-38]
MVKNYFPTQPKPVLKKNKPILSFALIAIYILTSLAAYSQSCTINAGLDQIICGNDRMQLQGVSPDTYADGPTWSQVSGPSVIISDPNIDDPEITGFVAGNTYTFRYAATCFNGDTPFQEVSIRVEPVTQASAGADIASCPDNTGAIVISGNSPANSGETGLWTIEGANNAGVTINLPNSASTPITLADNVAGTTRLRWTIRGANFAPGRFCSSFDELIITNYGGQNPIEAGNNQTLSNCYTVSQNTRLNGSFGGNNLNGQQGTWIFVSGPSNPTISNINNARTPVSNLIEGTYTLRWEVVGPCAMGLDTVTITVPEATQDVTPAFIENDNVRFCDAGATEVTLVGSTPDFTNETVQWTQIAGPAATIESPTNSTTRITGLSNPNSYQFQYTITNNITGCTTSDTGRVRYDVNTIFINVNNGNNIVTTCGETSASIPFTFTGGNQTQFRIVSGPDDSALSFPTNYQTISGNSVTVNSFDAPGTYRINFRRRRTGDQLTSCDEANDAINVTISAVPSGANGGSDQFLNCGLTNASLAGNAINDGEQSVWTQVSGPNTATISDIYAQAPSISNMIPGTYIFRYTVTAGPSCTPPATAETRVEVSPTSNNPVEAGPNRTDICINAPVQLDADPGTAAQFGTWSGPPGITFKDINDPKTIATGFIAGTTTYTLTWTLDNNSDSGCTLAPASDTMTVTTNNFTSPTPSDAGPDQCLNTGTTSVTLAGNEPGTNEQGQWTVTPTSGVTFTDDTAFNAVATVPGDGIYTFTWTIGYNMAPPGNTCPATSDSVEVVIADTAAVVDAGPDQSLCLDPNTLSFNMNADPAPAGGIGTWNLVSGSRFSVDDENSPTATFSNLLDGVYVFEWVITYGDCPAGSTPDQVTIEVGIPPTPANIPAGNQVICSDNNTVITADPLQNPNTEFGTWALVSGPNSPNINDPGSNSINVTNLITGLYTFSWTVTSNSPLCPVSTATVDVEVFAPVSAGPDQDLCEVTSVLLEASAGATGTWTQVGTITDAATITQSPTNSNTANATVTPGNTYLFEFNTDYTGNGATCNSSDQVEIVVSSGPSSPPMSGPDQILCNGDTTQTTLAGNTPPGDPGLMATWSFLAAPTGSVANITTPTANNTTVTGLSVPGVYILQWNFATANCSSEADIMRMEVFEAPTPVEAGPDQTNACQQDIQLNATTPTAGIGTWSFANPGDDPSGGTIVIDSPNNPQTTLSNIPNDIGNDGVADVYLLTWTVSTGQTFPDLSSACNPQSDTVEVTFTGTPPTPADAGPDQSFCDRTQTFMDAVDLTEGSGTWTQTAGPIGPTIASPNNPNTLIIDFVPGIYEFTWTVTGGGCTDTDTVSIEVQQGPGTANAGPDQTVNEFETIQLNATPATAPTTGEWTQISGPSTANFIDASAPNTQVTGTVAGSYIFEWTLSNGSCSVVSDQVTVNIRAIVDLELTKTVLPTAAKAGETVTFTIAVFNNDAINSSNASGVQVTDIIPNGYTLVPGTVSNSGLYNAGNLSVTWNNLSIPNGTTLNLTFDAEINETGTYINTAEITGGNEFDSDSTPNNNNTSEDDQDTAEVTVTPNDNPVAVRDEDLNNTIGDNVEISILTNDTDVDGTIDPASVNLIVPSGITGMPDIDGDIIGFVVFNEGTWEYNANTGVLTFSPEPGFTGNPTIIEYTVRDDSGNTSNQAEVEVTYTVAPPIANNDQNLDPSPIGTATVLNIINNDQLPDGSIPNPDDVAVDLDPGTTGVQTSITISGEGAWSYNETTGEITFTPDAGFTTDPTPLTYTLIDLDTNQTDTAIVTVVYEVPPVAVNDFSTGNTVGTTVSLSIIGNDTDADGTIDSSMVNLVAPTGATNIVTDLDGDVIGFTVPDEGTWSYNQATGQLEFDPINGFTGNPTDITYTVRDNDGNESNVATVSVGYGVAAPIANNDTNSIATPIGNNTDIAVLNNDTLADGTTPMPSDVAIDLDTATPGIQTTFTAPGEGTWDYDTGTGILTFDPLPAFTGNPTPITYELTDLDNNQTDTALITITYQVPPVAVNDSNTGNTVGSTVSVAIISNDTDADGSIDPATVDLVAPGTATNIITDLDGDVIGFTVPGEGTWSYSQATGQLEFDPINGFTGNPTDVTYIVRDNDGNESNVATVSVGYGPAAPIANDDTNTTATSIGTNTDVAILNNDTLADGTTPMPSDVTIDLDTATPGIQTTFIAPGEGTWDYDTGTGVLTFDPEPTFTGNPTPITYELTDLDNNQTDTALITITYEVPPVAGNDSSTGNTVGTTVSIAIISNDTDADGTIDPATVDLVAPGTATNIITDLDGDVIGFTVPGEGTWSYNQATGQLEFDPINGFTGNPTDITYTVRDNDGNESNVATVSVGYGVAAPIANNDTNSIATPIGNNTDIAILNNDTLADGSTPIPSDVTIDLDLGTTGIQTTFTAPGEGTWDYDTGTGILTFDPEPAFTGNPTPITYELTDLDNNQTDTALVTITYEVPPVAVNDSSTGNTVGTTVSVAIISNDTDTDGSIDPATVDLVAPGTATNIITDLDGDVIGFTVPGEGTWSYNQATGQLEFDPINGFTGNPTNITYTVRDNDGNTSNVATVSVGYGAVAPIANDDTNTTATPIGANTDVTILNNDTLADGTTPMPLDVTIDLDPGTTGIQTTLSVAGEGTWDYDTGTGVLTFDPEPTFTGNPTPITYELTDLDNNQTDTALVTITYEVPPVAGNDSSTGNTVGTTVSVAIISNDTDADGMIDPATVDLVAPGTATNIITDLDGDVIGFTVPGEGTWSYSQATGQLEFDPINGFTGNPTDITYTVRDNDGNESNVATVSVGYGPAAPIANNDTNSIATPIGTNTDITILNNDTLADGTTPMPSDITIDLDTATPGIQATFIAPGEGTWDYDTGIGILTFDPEPAFTGNPTPITYELTDLDNNQTDTALVTITYEVPPVAGNDSSTGNTVGTTVSLVIISNDTDTDGTIDPATVDLVAPGTATNIIIDLDGDVIGFSVPGEGTWSYSQATGQLEFDPINGFTGNPTDISYTVRDNDGNTSNVATVNITYNLNEPIPEDDNRLNNITNTSVSLDILLNDRLADGSTPLPSDVFVNLITPGSVTTSNPVTGANGTTIGFTVQNEGIWLYNEVSGSITFTPETGFTADPTPITYTIQDSDNNAISTTSATITIDYDIQAPIARDDENLGNTPGNTVTLLLLTNDSDPDGSLDPASVNLATPVGASTILTDADGDVIGFDVPGEGSWLYDLNTETIIFSPLPGFITQPTPITYTIDDNDGNLSNNAEIRVDYLDVANLSLVKSVVDGDLTPLPGTEITFRITVTNDGPDTATGVQVRDQLPTGFDFVLFSSTAGSYDENTGIWNVGTVPSGNSEVLLIDVLVNTTGNFTNIAEISASDVLDLNSTPNNDDGDQSEDDEDVVTITPVQSQADLSLEKTVVDGDTSPLVGTEITFRITITNDGPQTATGVQVRDQLPSGFDFVLFSSTAGSYDENTGIWNVGTVPSGSSEVLLIDVLVNPTGDYTNIAEVSASDVIDNDSTPDNDDGDQSEDDEDAVTITPVQSQADLSLEKTVVDGDTSPLVGTEITFRITVTNDGPQTATGVQVRDQLPTGFDFVLFSSTAGNYDENTGIWNVGTVPSGSSEVLLIDVLVNPTGDYTNIAEVSASDVIDNDSTPNNDDGDQSEDDEDNQVITPVQSFADISLNKAVVDNDINVQPGDEITFQVVVTNDGPDRATGIQVSDVLPVGFDFILFSTTSGTYDENTGVWNVGTIPSGFTQTLLIDVLVNNPTGTPGEFINVAEVTAGDQIDPDSSVANDDGDQSEDDEDRIQIFVERADLSLEKSVNTNTPNVGETVTFTLQINNEGPDAATGVSVEDTLPIGFNQVSVVSNAGTYEAAENKVVWNNLTIPVGGLSLTFETIVQEPTLAEDEYVNVAQITGSNQFDPDSSPANDNGDQSEDDEDNAFIQTPGIDIEVTKEVSNANPSIGDEILFTITAINTGTLAATNVRIEDRLPTGYRYLTHETTSGTYNENTGIWEVPSVSNSGSEILTVSVEVLDIDDYVNIATLLDLDQIDGDPTNDSDEITITTICLNVYNEFTPNNDGTNDFFYIDCIERFPGNKLIIYNRWGNIVYQKQNYDNSWQGTSNGRAVIYTEEQLPVGTYYYTLDLNDGNDPKSGWIYLNR